MDCDGHINIQRVLKTPVMLDFSNIHKIDALFIIMDNNVVTINHLLNHYVDNKYISETSEVTENTKICMGNDADFLTLCQTNRNVHKVKYDNPFKYFELVESNIGADLNVLRKYALVKDAECEILERHELPATILFAYRGMGATTYLKQVKEEIMLEDPETFALFLEELDLGVYFAEENPCRSLKIAFIHFYEINVNNANIHILIDNFEFMQNKYQDELIQILSEIHLQYRNIKLWMVCSNTIIRDKLESKFGTFASYFDDISSSDIDYYVRYTSQRYSFNYPRSYEFCHFAPCHKNVNIKDKFNSSLFTNYPFHLWMMIYYLEDDTECDSLVLRIYDNYFKGFNKTEHELQELEKIALIYICKKNNLEAELDKDEYNLNYNVNIEDEEQGKVKYLCSLVVYYLAAVWISKNLHCFSFQYRKLITSKFTNWQLEYFVDKILCNSAITRTVLNLNIEDMKKYCNNITIMSEDGGGRNVLHLCHSTSIANDIFKEIKRDLYVLLQPDNIYNLTPLGIMDLKSDMYMVNWLLKHNSNSNELSTTLNSLNDTELERRLYFAVEHGLSAYVKILSIRIQSKITPEVVSNAIIYTKEQRMIMNLLDKALENEHDSFEECSRIATLRCNVDVIKKLHEKSKLNLHYRYRGGFNLLHIASRYGSIDILKYLLKKCKMDPNVRNDFGENSFLIACLQTNMRILSILITYNADTACVSSSGMNAMHIAIDSGNHSAILFLIKKYSLLKIPYPVNRFFKDELLLIAQNLNLVKQVLCYRKSINKSMLEKFMFELTCYSEYNKDYEQIASYICSSNHLGYNRIDDKSRNLLFMAAKGGNESYIRHLLTKGVQVTHVNIKEETVLFFLDHNISRKSVQLLLSHPEPKLNVNAQSKDGNTALHVACDRNTSTVVECLIQNGANVLITNKDGDIPLHIVCSRGFIDMECIDIVKVLLTTHKEEMINYENLDGETPIMKVEPYSDDAYLLYRILIDAGANVGHQDKHRENIIHVCTKGGFLGALKFFFLESKTLDAAQQYPYELKNAKVLNKDRQNALHIAAEENNYECFKYLLDNYTVDISMSDLHGHTALNLTECPKIIRLLRPPVIIISDNED